MLLNHLKWGLIAGSVLAVAVARSQAPIPLASFTGEYSWNRLGYWLCEAGDVNGDGYDDFFTGQYHYNTKGYQGEDYGCAYLVLGKKDAGWNFNVKMNQANAKFYGARWDAAAWCIAGKGDVDNDGLDDFIIGAPDGNENHAGDLHAYLYFGRSKADWGNNVALRSYADVTFNSPELHDGFGGSCAMIGDINGDGYDDFLIAAKVSSEYNTYSGKVFLFLGRERGSWPSTLTTAGAACIFYSDEKYRQAGYSVSGLGDINGDGVPDFIIGSKRIDRTNWTLGYEKAFVFFGRTGLNWQRPCHVSNADVIMQGETNASDATAFVDWAGDVNGDGLNDILFGGHAYDNLRGKVYLLLGRRQWNQKTYYLKTDADASWYGEARGNRVGGWMRNVGGAGDVNADGYDDILIGAPYYILPPDSMIGKAYLIFGKAAGWQLNVNLNQVNPAFLGEKKFNYFGDAVSRAGDVNGDGAGDIIISAPHNSQSIYEAGKVYLYKGQGLFVDIAGKVLFSNNQAPAKDVILGMEGEENINTVTDELGIYRLECPKRGGTVVPQKPDGFLPDITAHDAVFAARSHLGMVTLNPSELLMADVDGDGDVDIMDAVQICRFSVGLPSGATSIGEWIFTPESRSYSNLTSDMEDQDYECCIIGDLDGSGTGLGKSSGGDTPVHTAPVERHAENNMLRIGIPVISDVSVYSIDAALEYDPEYLSFQDARLSPESGVQAFWNETRPGMLRVGIMNPEGFREAGLEFYFERADEAGMQAMPCFEEFRVNGRSMIDRIVDPGNPAGKMPEGIFMAQNFPNPFNAHTVIRFRVPAGREVRIRIYNSGGRMLKSSIFPKEPGGLREWIWDGTDEKGQPAASGVYHCEISADPDRKRIKLLLIR
ncbi:FG-GAP repeat protein [bacterium]|nr:FG-GAP repeat protein [bacterium]